jgi:hypothetical protein
MGLLNVGSGLFSAAAGLSTAVAGKVPFRLSEGNPWLYVLGGSITALLGVGNWFGSSLATWGTVLFILTSAYDGWFGAGRKDWRLYTLSVYVLVQSSLVLWSTQVKSLFTMP